MAEKKDTTKLVELKVTIDNHTHDGALCKKGDTIRVAENVAVMLREKWAEINNK